MNVGVYFNKNHITDNKPYYEKLKAAFSGKHSLKVVNEPKDVDGIETLFVLGGDGTILNVAAKCAVENVKIIGVNYGHLGFLAEFEPEKLDDAINLVLKGKYKLQKRSMLSVECEEGKFLALNDVVIQRNTSGGDFCNTVNLRAEIDGATVDNFASDGIIVSTPTGSTAYSLAAGGSILTPDIEAFIMTPICAHSLHSRPVVYSDKSCLKIYGEKANTPLICVVDGKTVCKINGEEAVTVKKSDNFVNFITKDETNFFRKLLIKLNIWSK